MFSSSRLGSGGRGKVGGLWSSPETGVRGWSGQEEWLLPLTLVFSCDSMHYLWGGAAHPPSLAGKQMGCGCWVRESWDPKGMITWAVPRSPQDVTAVQGQEHLRPASSHIFFLCSEGTHGGMGNATIYTWLSSFPETIDLHFDPNSIHTLTIFINKGLFVFLNFLLGGVGGEERETQVRLKDQHFWKFSMMSWLRMLGRCREWAREGKLSSPTLWPPHRTLLD